MEETKTFQMPIVVCQVGSGILAVLAMATGLGAILGFVAVLLWLHGPEVYPAPPPSTFSSVVLFASMGGVVLVVWWQARKPLYAHCLRYWHPEIAPPQQVPCEECKTCGRCGGHRWIDEPSPTRPLKRSDCEVRPCDVNIVVGDTHIGDIFEGTDDDGGRDDGWTWRVWGDPSEPDHYAGGWSSEYWLAFDQLIAAENRRRAQERVGG